MMGLPQVFMEVSGTSSAGATVMLVALPGTEGR